MSSLAQKVKNKSHKIEGKCHEFHSAKRNKLDKTNKVELNFHPGGGKKFACAPTTNEQEIA